MMCAFVIRAKSENPRIKCGEVRLRACEAREQKKTERKRATKMRQHIVWPPII